MFLKSIKSHPTLNALPITERGKESARMWRSLSVAEQVAFAAKGQKTVVSVRVRTPKKKGPRKSRGPTALNIFFKTNYRKVAHLPPSARFGALASLWNAHKIAHGAPRSS